MMIDIKNTLRCEKEKGGWEEIMSGLVCDSELLQMLRAYLILLLKADFTALRYLDEKGREREREESNQIKEN